MSTNVGKVFENNWKASVPGNIFFYRPPDAAQSFNQSSNLRFSQHSPCDNFMFNGFTATFYTLELKSVKTNSISFEREKTDRGVIHKHQIDSLLKFSKYKNVVSGFIFDFRTSDNTYFLSIDNFISMIDGLDKKSFNEKDLINSSPIIIKKRKLKVNYRYDIETFLEETKMN